MSIGYALLAQVSLGILSVKISWPVFEKRNEKTIVGGVDRIFKAF
jgi:hypothetical protein